MLTDDQIHDALSSILERRDPDVPATVLGAGSDDLGVGLRYLEALVDVGAFITDELGKVSRSRAANAIVAKRKMREEAQKRAAAKAAKGEPTKEHPMN